MLPCSSDLVKAFYELQVKKRRPLRDWKKKKKQKTVILLQNKPAELIIELCTGDWAYTRSSLVLSHQVSHVVVYKVSHQTEPAVVQILSWLQWNSEDIIHFITGWNMLSVACVKMKAILQDFIHFAGEMQCPMENLTTSISRSMTVS